MAVLKASEKLKILALGKATLKEINDLEKQAEKEKEPEPKPDPEPKPEPEPEPKPDPEPEPEPDEKDLKIEELEKQVKDLQKKNVNQDNSGDIEDNETALLDIFKNFR